MKKLLIAAMAAAVMAATPVYADPLATAENDAGKLSILGYTTTADSQNDYLVCLLDYENTGSTANSAGMSFVITAYQNGVQLTKYMAPNGYEYEDYIDSFTNVLPGTSVKVFEFYALTDTEGEITLEVNNIVSFSNEPLATCTFNLSDDGTPDPAEASDQAEAPADAAPADDAIAALEQRIADLEQRVSALENQ